MRNNLCLFLMLILQVIAFGQKEKRNPDTRKDYVNVFYDPKYTLYDFWSDEPIFPEKDDTYKIYYATNENKTPSVYTGNKNDIKNLIAYKFKTFENCSNWCKGIAYQQNISKSNNKEKETRASKSTQLITTNFENEITNVSLDKLDCETCKDAITVYHMAWEQKLQISKSDIEKMKILLYRCTLNKYDECDKKKKKLFEEMQGILPGGGSPGDFKIWWINPNKNNWDANSTKTKFRFYLDYKKTINDFKKIVDDQSVECSNCKQLISEYYESFQLDPSPNKTKTNLSKSEFERQKIKILDCKFILYGKCDDKMDKELDLLSGRAGKGVYINGSAAGSGSIWRLEDYRNIIQDEKPITNKRQIQSTNDYIFERNGKIGIMDDEGYEFIKPVYSNINPFNLNSNLLFAINDNNKYGIIDSDSKILLSPTLDNFVFSTSINNKFIGYSKNNSWGIIKFKPFTIIQTEYDQLQFAGLWNIVKKNGKLGFLNDQGILIGDMQWDDVVQFSEYYIPSQNILAVKRKNKIGFVDKNSKEIIPPLYDEVGVPASDSHSTSFIQGIIRVKQNGKYGYINESGTTLIAPQYDSIIGFDIFDTQKSNPAFVKKGGKWGLIDRLEGKEITPIKYDTINKFIDGVAKITVDKKYGLINTQGIELIKPQFDKLNTLTENTEYLISQVNGLSGLIKINGSIIIPAKYQSIESNTGKYWNVKLANKIGLITEDGTVIIEPKYQEIGIFREGLASVKLNGKYGLINANGNLSIPTAYDNPISFTDGKAKVSQNGNSFSINLNGEVVINNFQNSRLENLKHGYYTIKYQISEEFGKLYQTINGYAMVGSLLGTSTNNSEKQKLIATRTREIKEMVEEWLGGPLTKAQTQEFNEINQNAAAIANFAGALLFESVKSEIAVATQRANQTNSGFNAWQCSHCGVVSRSTQKPSGGDFGGYKGCLNSNYGHNWNRANTNHGWQCSRCGEKSLIINEHGTKPAYRDFGGCKESSTHSWTYF